MIIAGTGHRPDKVGGYSKDVKIHLITVATNYLLTIPRDTIIISGMALGWDQALAQAALALDFKVWAYVPFLGQESKWPQEIQDHYKLMLSYCDKVKYCSEPGYSAMKMQIRNAMMVDDADSILAYYNGTPGGTQNCINYANAKGKPVINLYKAQYHE